MTSDGSPYARFRRALNTQNLLLVTATAREMPYIGLPDALAIVLLMESADHDRFDAAAVRWVGRLALETPDLTLSELAKAATALDALPADDARATLLRLAQRTR